MKNSSSEASHHQYFPATKSFCDTVTTVSCDCSHMTESPTLTSMGLGPFEESRLFEKTKNYSIICEESYECEQNMKVTERGNINRHSIPFYTEPFEPRDDSKDHKGHYHVTYDRHHGSSTSCRHIQSCSVIATEEDDSLEDQNIKLNSINGIPMSDNLSENEESCDKEQEVSGEKSTSASNDELKSTKGIICNSSATGVQSGFPKPSLPTVLNDVDEPQLTDAIKPQFTKADNPTGFEEFASQSHNLDMDEQRSKEVISVQQGNLPPNYLTPKQRDDVHQSVRSEFAVQDDDKSDGESTISSKNHYDEDIREGERRNSVTLAFPPPPSTIHPTVAKALGSSNIASKNQRWVLMESNRMPVKEHLLLEPINRHRPERAQRKYSESKAAPDIVEYSSQPSSFKNKYSIEGGTHKRSVQFTCVTVRNYNRILGDNPSCSKGPSISIGWQYNSYVAKMSIDKFEAIRYPYRASSTKSMMLSRYEREEILKDLGYARSDIADAVRKNQKVKSQRRTTVNNLCYSRAEEAVEKVTRKMKAIVTLKWARKARKKR